MERDLSGLAYDCRQIYLPVTPEAYAAAVADRHAFRAGVDAALGQYPELFPPEAQRGYVLHGHWPPSAKMPTVVRRRSKVADVAYTLMPAYLLPYLTGATAEVRDALFLHQFGVPYWALAYVFGHAAMYWARLVLRLGRNSVVGTTVKDPAQLPPDLLADEKHTWLNGERVYVAPTVGDECVLGAGVASQADEPHLTAAYQTFRDAAQAVAPDYTPQTVNLDGWQATHLAWATLFPLILIIPCCLPACRSFCDRGQRSGAPHFQAICRQIWAAYHAPTALQFVAALAALRAWAVRTLADSPARTALLKLCARAADFAVVYDYPQAHRTSNMLDRQMDRMDRCFYSAHYFHGQLMTRALAVRAGARLHNFTPDCPRTATAQHYTARAHRLNGRVYHTDWLQNLLIAAARGGFRQIHRIQ